MGPLIYSNLRSQRLILRSFTGNVQAQVAGPDACQDVANTVGFAHMAG